LSEPYVIACINVAAETDTEANRLATSFKTILGIITGNRQQLQPPVASDSEFWDQ
jgi:hypothetical protein